MVPLKAGALAAPLPGRAGRALTLRAQLLLLQDVQLLPEHVQGRHLLLPLLRHLDQLLLQAEPGHLGLADAGVVLVHLLGQPFDLQLQGP